MLALVCTGCLVSGTWIPARRPSLRQPFGTRHSSALVDGESASRRKKWGCFASLAPVRYYLFERNP